MGFNHDNFFFSYDKYKVYVILFVGLKAINPYVLTNYFKNFIINPLTFVQNVMLIKQTATESLPNSRTFFVD